MLMNFWYAIEFSQAIADRPQLIQLFDHKITLYRNTQGVIHALGDICPHRGASLALGTVQGGCLVCPYHGWHFAADGQCVKIPANAPGATIPKRAIAATYPIQEKDGWIWLFWGDATFAATTAIPAIPQVSETGLRSIQGDFHWNVNYARAMDNGLDFAHAPFVHAGAFGNPEEPEVGDLAITSTAFGAEATVMLKPNQPKGIWRLLAAKAPKPVETRTGFALPNLTFLEVNLPFGRLVIWTAHVPIDDTTTVSKWMNFRSFFTGKWADSDARKRTLKIFAQDQPIVEAQVPHSLPSGLSAEIHVAADGLQLKYREYRDRAMQNPGRSLMVD
jgi:phenylpropionate dioxygenase-like ring-hydroxylating dioxygenase large terminal subunit